MTPLKYILIPILLVQTVYAQNLPANNFSSIDSVAIPDSLTKTTKDLSGYIATHFTTDKKKVKAAFTWIATNMEYDIDNMFAINFYETRDDKITKGLTKRKGICENYAYLFIDICLKLGIKSFPVEGYTKQNGIASYVPHVWCCALIDNSWHLFDPTWGAGYIGNGKFHKKFNETYFMIDPATLIKSHMPFDFLWQFLNYPITNQEFYTGATDQDTSKSFFNFTDSIKVYEGQSEIEKLIASSNRIEKNGTKNSLIFDRLQHIKLEIENEKQKRSMDLYNAAIVDYNIGIREFNAFVKYRNNQFKPTKPATDIRNMINSASAKLKEAKTKLKQIDSPDPNGAVLISQLNNSIDQTAGRIKEQQEWLKIYFSKGKTK